VNVRNGIELSMLSLPQWNNKFCFTPLLLLSIVFPQEPEPIQAGLAPPSGIYAPGINALHYDVEIGLGKETDWFAGKVKVKIALDENSPVLPLDFSGLELLQLSVQGNKTTYSYQDGVIRIPLKNFQKNDTVVVELYYRGFPDDGLILNKNIHGERTAFVDN
ncbi:uncharacterized protein METZ01_LOCUS396929, partial [marine metagenome]